MTNTSAARRDFARPIRTYRPISLLGIVLVPLIVAGVLAWAVWDPQERLAGTTAAIVNNDQPVQVDGETVPLGRQMTAELVSDLPNESADETYTWVVTDKDDAAEGLASGRYTAVVTIPENFSTAATSVGGDPSMADAARIDVATSGRSKLVDDAISNAIASFAAAALGRTLTTGYLDNIYLGFNTLSHQIGEAAAGAVELSDGGRQLTNGAQQLADGSAALSSGASQLAAGTLKLSTGTGRLSEGLNALNVAATGDPTSPGLAAGATAIADGASGVAGGIRQTQTVVTAQGTELLALSAECDPVTSGTEFCSRIAVAANTVAGIGAGMGQLSVGAGQLSFGAQQYSIGITQFTGGLSQLAAGAVNVDAGVSTLSGGANDLAAGAADLAAGTAKAATGAADLSGGITSLSEGLTTAADQLPSYSADDRQILSSVVSDPVRATSSPTFSASGSAPFYLVLALWLGAMAIFLVFRAVPAGAFGSTGSSLRLALRSYLPAGAVGAVQGILAVALLAPILQLEVGRWMEFAGIGLLAGAAFAAVTQALSAAFGGVARFIGLIVAIVGIATAVTSSTPGVLAQLQTFSPLQPALGGLQSVLLSQTGTAAAVTGLLVWLLASLAFTTAAIARKRTISAKDIAKLGVRVA